MVRCLQQQLSEEAPHRPKRLLVFVNPFGGKRQAEKAWSTKVLPIFNMVDIKCQVVMTQYRGHAGDVMAHSNPEWLLQFDGVVVVGGDGLFNEVLNGMLKHAAPSVDVRTGNAGGGQLMHRLPGATPSSDTYHPPHLGRPSHAKKAGGAPVWATGSGGFASSSGNNNSAGGQNRQDADPVNGLFTQALCDVDSIKDGEGSNVSSCSSNANSNAVPLLKGNRGAGAGASSGGNFGARIAEAWRGGAFRGVVGGAGTGGGVAGRWSGGSLSAVESDTASERSDAGAASEGDVGGNNLDEDEDLETGVRGDGEVGGLAGGALRGDSKEERFRDFVRHPPPSPHMRLPGGKGADSSSRGGVASGTAEEGEGEATAQVGGAAECGYAGHHTGVTIGGAGGSRSVTEASRLAAGLRLGIIPAGSTDTIAYSAHGTRDVVAAALHIALGDRLPIDVGLIQTPEGVQEYACSFCGYGFFGDVMRMSEHFRWMGPSRYDFAGTLAVLGNRSYRARVSYLVPGADSVHGGNEAATMINGVPAGRKGAGKQSICVAGCDLCLAAQGKGMRMMRAATPPPNPATTARAPTSGGGPIGGSANAPSASSATGGSGGPTPGPSSAAGVAGVLTSGAMGGARAPGITIGPGTGGATAGLAPGSTQGYPGDPNHNGRTVAQHAGGAGAEDPNCPTSVSSPLGMKALVTGVAAPGPGRNKGAPCLQVMALNAPTPGGGAGVGGSGGYGGGGGSSSSSSAPPPVPLVNWDDQWSAPMVTDPVLLVADGSESSAVSGSADSGCLEAGCQGGGGCEHGGAISRGGSYGDPSIMTTPPLAERPAYAAVTAAAAAAAASGGSSAGVGMDAMQIGGGHGIGNATAGLSPGQTARHSPGQMGGQSPGQAAGPTGAHSAGQAAGQVGGQSPGQLAQAMSSAPGGGAGHVAGETTSLVPGGASLAISQGNGAGGGSQPSGPLAGSSSIQSSSSNSDSSSGSGAGGGGGGGGTGASALVAASAVAPWHGFPCSGTGGGGGNGDGSAVSSATSTPTSGTTAGYGLTKPPLSKASPPLAPRVGFGPKDSSDNAVSGGPSAIPPLGGGHAGGGGGGGARVGRAAPGGASGLGSTPPPRPPRVGKGTKAERRAQKLVDMQPLPGNWVTIEGEFMSVAAAIISCRNDKAVDGASRHAHLCDGHLDLIIVKKCSRLQQLRQLIMTSKKGADPFTLKNVEVHKTIAFHFTPLGQESAWNVDGEILQGNQVYMHVHPGLVTLFARGPES
eukprot:jgi/Mesvir1/7181/Mv18209-RA.1